MVEVSGIEHVAVVGRVKNTTFEIIICHIPWVS